MLKKVLSINIINGNDTTKYGNFLNNSNFYIAVNRKKESIVFSDATKYDIYDTYGNLIRKDEARTLKVNGLKKGLYYFNFVSDEQRSYSYVLNLEKSFILLPPLSSQSQLLKLRWLLQQLQF